MSNVVEKIRKRLPGGEFYEILKQQKRLIAREQEPFCQNLMLSLYKKRRDIYFRGGADKSIGMTETLNCTMIFSSCFILNLCLI